jgi:hypothetical protein
VTDAPPPRRRQCPRLRSPATAHLPCRVGELQRPAVDGGTGIRLGTQHREEANGTCPRSRSTCGYATAEGSRRAVDLYAGLAVYLAMCVLFVMPAIFSPPVVTVGVVWVAWWLPSGRPDRWSATGRVGDGYPQAEICSCVAVAGVDTVPVPLWGNVSWGGRGACWCACALCWSAIYRSSVCWSVCWSAGRWLAVCWSAAGSWAVGGCCAGGVGGFGGGAAAGGGGAGGWAGVAGYAVGAGGSGAGEGGGPR